ncbi:hypothetical protein [Frankia tisae]|uniref:hypothetical protein n=1 Tax=Frankia tisae TaxID=2950104 RepID=UPI0021C138CF|nr:hypothetical protein [Frankia tisae]
MLRASVRLIGRPVQRTVAFTSFVLAAVSGYYGLESSGSSGTWLRVIGAMAALVLTGSLLEATTIDRIRKLRREITGLRTQMDHEREEHERQMATYTRSIARIADREKFLYNEEVHLTVEIGRDAAEDRITERRTTTPRPFLSHRTLGLIVPTGQNKVHKVHDLDLTWNCVDRAVNMDVLPIVEVSGKTKILLIFYPGLGETFEWILSYRPKGLWDPLRENGSDYLAWDGRAPHGVNERYISRFSVSFIFPEEHFRVGVLGNRGVGSDPERLPTGQWKIDWTDPHPTAFRYTWDIVTSRPTGGGG